MIRKIINVLRILSIGMIFLGCALTNMASADVSSMRINVPKDFNGHMWQELPEAVQHIFLKAYFEGYSWGYASGEIKAFSEGQKEILEFIKNKKICVVNNLEIEMYSDLGLYKKALHGIDNIGKIGKTTKDVDFYKKEIDAFYQTFPLCKSQNFLHMMKEFLTVWDEIWIDENSRTSYKEIGNKCLEKKSQ